MNAPTKQIVAAEEPQMVRARLPWHPRFEEEFGDLNVNKGSWRTLVEAVWPAAKSVESVQMALSYCKARRLDPFKRPVHIVPMWSSELSRMVETVWPGVSELRTTATRTGDYGGMETPEFGPTVTRKFNTVEIEFPEWCRVTLVRLVRGMKMTFPGPMVRWTESYAREKRDSPVPNSMWQKRPWGQLEKCAEAAALRRAFPEEIGNDYSAEEMEGQTLWGAGAIIEPDPTQPSREAPAAPSLKQAAVEHKPEPEIIPPEKRATKEPATQADAVELPEALDRRKQAAKAKEQPQVSDTLHHGGSLSGAPPEKQEALIDDAILDGETPDNLCEGLLAELADIKTDNDLSQWQSEAMAKVRMLPVMLKKRVTDAIARKWEEALSS